MGDARETTSRYIFEKMAHEGIETKHIVHMPGLVTPISAVMVDPSGERTIITFRDPELWKVRLPSSRCHAAPRVCRPGKLNLGLAPWFIFDFTARSASEPVPDECKHQPKGRADRKGQRH